MVKKFRRIYNRRRTQRDMNWERPNHSVLDCLIGVVRVEEGERL
jgi:hypothetical protein